MASTFALAPSFKWYFHDSEGRLANGGTLETFSSNDHTLPKAVFSDPAGTFPYLNPIILDGTGGTPVPIYWEDDGVDKYFVVVKDSNGDIIAQIDQYPIDGGGGATPATFNIDIENHVVNGQFHIIDADTVAASEVNPVPQNSTRVAGASGFFKDPDGNYEETLAGITTGWQFLKTGGANITDSIKFEDVTLIGTGYPGAPGSNAERFFTYTATSVGDPTTELNYECYIPNVETFSGETITFSFDAFGSTPAPGFAAIVQDFGTGGAPSATVQTSQAFNYPNAVWARQSFQINVPTVAGKNKGTDGNDFVSVKIRIPTNTIGNFSLTNIQVQIGTFASAPFIYQTYAQTQYKVMIDILNNISKASITGDTKFSINPTAAKGWIVVSDDNQTIGSAASGATFADKDTKELYILIYTGYADAFAPVIGGRTGTGTTPAEAETDFNANKPMRFPQWMGRVMGSAGTGLGLPPVTRTSAEGERTHQLTSLECPGLVSGADGGSEITLNPAPALGNPHNNMQPTAYLFLHIKL